MTTRLAEAFALFVSGMVAQPMAVALLSSFFVAPLAAQQDPPTIIRDVAVIDVLEGSVAEHQSVVIHNGRIVAIGPAGEVMPPAGAEVVDGSGKYLIPGLWDMHTHLLWSTDANEHTLTEMPRDADGWTLWERYYGPTLDLLVANGVTGIREMWGNLDVARRVRRDAAAGERLAPRIIVAGHIVDGPPGRWPGLVVVSTPAEARDAVDSLSAAGAEFIKVRYRVRPDAYQAIVERAQELGLPVVGHVPLLVPAAEASDAGQASIEHLTGVVEDCSAARDELIGLNRQLLAALVAGERATADSLEGRFFTRMLSTQDSDRCRALLRRLARNGTWLVPTLVLERGLPGGGTRGSEEPLLKYIHPGWLDSWTPEHSPYGQKTDEGYAQRLRDQERRVEITGMAAEEGVSIMSGTDTPNAFVFPGFALHDELELLVDAGLTPLQALQAATINPALFLNATDSLGTVEEGKVADLVLLEANPLADISNTQRIEAVVVGGRYLAREALDAVLAGAERAADPAREAVETAIRAYLDAFAAQDPERIRGVVTEDFVVIENGYPISLDRATEGMEPRHPLPMRYRLDDLQVEIDGDLAVYRFDLGWFAEGEQMEWGLETGHARRIDGEWKLAQNHMTFLPVRGHVPVAALRDYEGDYQGLDFQGGEDLIRLYLDDERLFMTRPNGRPLIGGILRLGMLPDPAGGFFVEVLNGRVEFEAGPNGEVSGFTYIPPPEQHPDYRSPLRYERVVEAPATAAQSPETGAAPAQIQDGWRTAAPAEVGMDPARLEELTRSLRRGEHRNVHAVLIEKDGRLVYEEYFTGEDETWDSSLGTVTFGRASLHDVRSVSKSVVSTLVGIAIGGGEIPSVDARLRDLLPEYAAFLDGEKAEIRLRHVLSMSAGLEWDEWSQPYSHPQNDWQQLTRAADPVAFILDRDLVHDPGGTFTYSGGLTHLLAVILERATGEQFDDYARRVLFEPLGVHDAVWLGRIGGIPSADAGLRLRARDLAKIGSLFLNGGRWNGRQIVPERWVAEAPIGRVIPTAVEPVPAFALDVGYGYQWWSTRYATSHGEVDVNIMSGKGQQRVMVVPELSLAATMFAGHYNDASAEIGWMPDRLLVDYIIDALVPQRNGGE